MEYCFGVFNLVDYLLRYLVGDLEFYSYDVEFEEYIFFVVRNVVLRVVILFEIEFVIVKDLMF